MPVNLVPEDDLRTALRPYRVDPDTFEAAVRERLKAAEGAYRRPPGQAFPTPEMCCGISAVAVLTGCKPMPEPRPSWFRPREPTSF